MRGQLFEAQIEKHNIEVGLCQLNRILKIHTKGARYFKQVYIKKEIYLRNKAKRVEYDLENKDKAIEIIGNISVSQTSFTDQLHAAG